MDVMGDVVYYNYRNYYVLINIKLLNDIRKFQEEKL